MCDKYTAYDSLQQENEKKDEVNNYSIDEAYKRFVGGGRDILMN